MHLQQCPMMSAQQKLLIEDVCTTESSVMQMGTDIHPAASNGHFPSNGYVMHYTVCDNEEQ